MLQVEKRVHKTTRSARLSAIPVMPFPPVGCGRSPPYLPAGDGERLALSGSALLAARRGYLHPPPNRPNG